MNEKHIIDMIVMYHGTYYKFRDEKDFTEFKHWMLQLQKFKGFADIDETIAYYHQETGYAKCGQAS